MNVYSNQNVIGIWKKKILLQIAEPPFERSSRSHIDEQDIKCRFYDFQVNRLMPFFIGLQREGCGAIRRKSCYQLSRSHESVLMSSSTESFSPQPAGEKEAAGGVDERESWSILGDNEGGSQNQKLFTAVLRHTTSSELSDLNACAVLENYPKFRRNFSATRH